jgi:RNA polymerase sigma-70 factor (ECF subfamily)
MTMFEIIAGEPLLQQDEWMQAVARARANPAAFKPIYEEFFPRIYRYCLRRVESAQEAEDLTSLIFTRAIAALGGYRGGSFAAWLFRIAHNVIVNHLRGRHITVPLEDAERGSARDEMLGHLMEEEETQAIRRLVAKLPEEQRELIALRITGGLSAKEIGQVVGKSEGAVRVAIHRTLQQLRAAAKEMIQ